jgi:uncharacterized membrane protein YfcA
MSFTPEPAALLVAIGLAAGALGTLIGAGGGFILTPILLLMYPHDSPKTLTAISITAVFFNAASGSSAYARQRRIDYRSGTVFALATLPGAIAGALAVSVVSRAVFDDIMGGVLLTLALLLLAGERGRLPEPRRHLEHRLLVDRRGQSHEYSVPIRLGAAYSLGVGFLSSFLGIGGGVIHVPLLVSALGFPTHIATATSHFVLTITAATGTVTHLFLGPSVMGPVSAAPPPCPLGWSPAHKWAHASRSGCAGSPSNGYWPQRCLPSQYACSMAPEAPKTSE